MLQLLCLLSALFLAGRSDTTGCDGAKLKDLPTDPSARGPWEVGYRSFIHEGISTGIWYPAADLEGEARASAERTVVDIRKYLPEAQQGKIPDSKMAFQQCDSFDGIPLDEEHGKYPVMVFVHGTGAWQEQSCPQTVHWASRGYVVISQTHPGLYLGDQLKAIPLCSGSPAKQDLDGDNDIIWKAINEPQRYKDFAFLEGHIDTDRVAMSGHSAGGSSTARYAPNAKGVKAAFVLGSSNIPAKGTNEMETVMMVATEDALIGYDGAKSNFNNNARAPARFVGISKTGHLAFSEICSLFNAEGQNIYEIARETGVCGSLFMQFLFDCDQDLDDEVAWQVINHVTTAVMDEQLMCKEGEEERQLRDLKTRFSDVEDYITKENDNTTM